MENLIFAIVIIAYSIWGVYCGNRLLTGRIQWLDEPNAVNRICKFVLSLIVGFFYAAIYLVLLIFRLAIKLIFRS